MNGVGKVVPPKKVILKDISLNFFPGAKIGVLGYNGAGKSTLLRIMAGVDTDYIGEARPASDLRVGYLPQEPQLDESKDVRGNVEEGLSTIIDTQKRLEEVYAAYAEPDADFDALASEQAKLENIIQAADAHNLENKLEVAADALRLPPWDADVSKLSGGERRRVALYARGGDGLSQPGNEPGPLAGARCRPGGAHRGLDRGPADGGPRAVGHARRRG